VKGFDNFDLNSNFDHDKCIQFIFILITVVFYVIDYFYMHFAFKVFESEVKKSNAKIIKVTRTRCLISFVFKIFNADEVKKSIVETKKTTRTRCMIWLDILDTLSFAAIIIFINHCWYVFIIFPIILIFLVEKLYYIKNPETEKSCIICILSWISIIILLSFFLYYCTLGNCSNCCNLCLLVIYGLIVFIYATNANSFYKEEKSNLKNE